MMMTLDKLCKNSSDEDNDAVIYDKEEEVAEN